MTKRLLPLLAAAFLTIGLYPADAQDSPKKDAVKKDSVKKDAPKKDAPEKETPKKDAPTKDEPAVAYEITKVDTATGVITAKAVEGGKPITLQTGEDTKFMGPQGGKVPKGIKDDRLEPGNEIRVVMQGTKVLEVKLSVRKKKKDVEPKKDAPKPDTTKPKKE